MVQTRRKDDASYSTSKHLRSSARTSRGRIESSDNDDEDYSANVTISLHSESVRPKRHCTMSDGLRRASHVHHADTTDTDDEIASDESMFRARSSRSRSRRTRSSHRMSMRSLRSSSVEHARNSNGHTEVSMEDLPHQEDDGVRRSTRTRKPTLEALSSSWIVGNTRLRGYPSYADDKILPSSAEDGLKRESRRRYSNRSSSLQQQTTKSCLSTTPLPRSRRTTVKHEVKDEEEMQDGDNEETSNNLEEGQNGKKSGEGEVHENNDNRSSSDERSNNEERSSDDGTNNEARSIGDRRSLPRSSRLRSRLNTESDHHKLDDAFPDMYSRVKRTRRQVTRFAFSPGRRMVSRNRSSSDTDESEDSENDQPNKLNAQGSTRGSTRKYQLRAHKPAVDRFQAHHEPVRRPQRSFQKALCNSVLRRLGHRPTNRYSQNSSSSSSDSDARFDHKKTHSRHVPHNYHSKDGAKVAGHHHAIHSKDGQPTTLADIDPMTLDTSIRFEHVGGLEEHIQCLQEMVVFPILYKDIFEKFHITPPKGVLFHGPPGTGKTLIARALANECSQGDRKVTFFMRKGADCLSKWVGESERQLRLLFEQAFQKKPSIIFFDEIDGLAPVRSSKQDQIHASIVSTLLALMDGLDNRGEVIVIGATNRIDAIDPALRRPGRFDRELYFPLPACKERQEILQIHVRKWDSKPEPNLISELAEQSSGYCGSDLRALCADSVIQALRRTYPQIYKSSQKLLLDTNKVQVDAGDFALARTSIIPASHRVAPSPARKLRCLLEPLLLSPLNSVLKQIQDVFPQGLSRGSNVKTSVHRPRLLLSGTSALQAQTTHLAPALLHAMEHVAVFTLDLGTLYEVSARSPEETVCQVFQEARRNPPSIIYMPGLGQWWDLVPMTLQAVFLMQLEKLDMTSPIFVLATSDSSYDELAPEIRNLFSRYRDEVFAMVNPKEAEREAFFRPLLLAKAFAEPEPPKLTEDTWEELPLAPPPEPAKLTEEDLQKLYEKEEHTLRELRIFLREVCAKLARNRQFFMFTKPVDILEVPDYLEIIEQPMDLESMMTRIDQHHYVCAREFLDDIDLICRNALEYNPARDQADKLIRHRACFLRDTAYALIKAEMDSDFEDRCRSISRDRKRRKDSPSRFVPVPEFINTEPLASNRGMQVNGDKDASARAVNGELSSHSSVASNIGPVSNGASLASARKRRPSEWSRGLIRRPKKKKKGLNETDSPITTKQESSESGTLAVDVNNPCDLNSTLSPPSSPARQHSLSTSILQHECSESKDHQENEATCYSSMNGIQENSLSDVEMKESKSPGGGSMLSKNERLSTSKSPERASEANVDNSLKLMEKRRSRSFDSNSGGTAAAPAVPPTLPEVMINRNDLERLLTQIVVATRNCAVGTLVDLYVRLEKHVLRLQSQWDRSCLAENLREELQRFQLHHLNRK